MKQRLTPAFLRPLPQPEELPLSEREQYEADECAATPDDEPPEDLG